MTVATEPLCSVRDLRVELATPGGVFDAVAGVSLELPRGRLVALVGESGCGKTLTGMALLRLLPTNARAHGSITFDGVALDSLSDDEFRSWRGQRLAVVFQEPMTALNPVLSIRQQVSEPLLVHRRADRRAADRAAEAMLERVGLPDPARLMRQYPHQLSGGMRQRVMIAMALICGPDLLIADEPTTALDATTQLQILDLMAELQRDLQMTVLLITHDLSLVRQRADEVSIMYAGRIVEQGRRSEVLEHPRHPYSQALLEVAPDLSQPVGQRRLAVIPGDVPRPQQHPGGCAFHPRCSRVDGDPRCAEQLPILETGPAGQAVACWRAEPADRV